MSSIKRCSWFILASLIYSLPAHAIRCGVYVVTEGEYIYSVLQKCGPPQYRDEWTEYRGSRLKGTALDIGEVVPVRVQEWLYNFGPNMFMQLLRFENGRLIEIRLLEKGQ